jgi:hypothetical protein
MKLDQGGMDAGKVFRPFSFIAVSRSACVLVTVETTLANFLFISS